MANGAYGYPVGPYGVIPPVGYGAYADPAQGMDPGNPLGNLSAGFPVEPSTMPAAGASQEVGPRAFTAGLEPAAPVSIPRRILESIGRGAGRVGAGPLAGRMTDRGLARTGGDFLFRLGAGLLAGSGAPGPRTTTGTIGRALLGAQEGTQESLRRAAILGQRDRALEVEAARDAARLRADRLKAATAAPKSRTRTEGEETVTEEWDPRRGWVEVSRGPRQLPIRPPAGTRTLMTPMGPMFIPAEELREAAASARAAESAVGEAGRTAATINLPGETTGWRGNVGRWIGGLLSGVSPELGETAAGFLTGGASLDELRRTREGLGKLEAEFKNVFSDQGKLSDRDWANAREAMGLLTPSASDEQVGRAVARLTALRIRKEVGTQAAVGAETPFQTNTPEERQAIGDFLEAQGFNQEQVLEALRSLD